MNKSLKNKIKKFVEIPFDNILETDRCKPDCKYKLNIISFSILQLDIHNFVDQVYPWPSSCVKNVMRALSYCQAL